MEEMEHKLGALDDVAIEPIAPEHINSFHRGLDLVARERQYLGFRLISATLEQARRLGFVRIQLFVHADNTRAIALYRKVGFVEEGVLRDAAFMDGKFRDSLLMAKVDRANAGKETEI
jgi:RimJ/RimL family protein N-acetyltransferase